MTNAILPVPQFLEMESLADIRRQVYITFRQVLEYDKSGAKPVTKGRIKKLVKKTESMQPLRCRLGHEKLVEILRGMADEGLFESELRAWREFPEIFPHKPPDETTATKADLLAGCEEGQGEGSGDSFTDDDLGDSPPSGVNDAPAQDGKTPMSAEATLKDDIATHAHEGNTPKLPTGINLYLPYSAQHAILVPVQRILEETCFGFAQKYLPTVLQGKRYSCPAAVELTNWVKIFNKNRDSLGTVAPSLSSPSFQVLLEPMERLRNAAVHRIPKSTKAVLHLLSSAAYLAEMLQDNTRAGLIWDIRENVESSYRKSTDVCRALREAAVRELEEARGAREDLDLREKGIIKKMWDEGVKNKQDLGQQLERAVGDVIAEWEGRAAANLDPTDGPVQSEGSDMNLGISEDEEVSLGNESVEEKPVERGSSWSVL